MRQRREFNARRGNPTRHIPERWIPETAGNLITRHVKLIEQLEGRFNGETKQTHRYRLYPTWNSSIRGNQLYSIYHLQKSFNEFTVILDVPIKLNSNKAKWKVKEKKKRKKGSWKFGLWKVSKRMYSVKIEDLSLIFEIIFTLLVTLVRELSDEYIDSWYFHLGKTLWRRVERRENILRMHREAKVFK